MYAYDLIRFPELLEAHGIDVAKAHPALATQADQYNRRETDKVLAFWENRNKTLIRPDVFRESLATVV